METMNNKFVTEEGLAEYDKTLNDYLPPIKRGKGTNSFEHNGTAIGDYSHVEGYSINMPTTIDPENSETLDSETMLENWKATPCTVATGQGAHAEGGNTFAFGDYSHAEGEDTLSQGISSHAEGSSSQAIGDYSHAEGLNTIAIGEASHAEGYSRRVANLPNDFTDEDIIEAWNSKSFIFAKGKGSHAEGGNTLAIGDYSHAEGYEALASGEYSHAEGENTSAKGQAAHAEGCYSSAVGPYSHAEGDNTTAGGEAAHAEGYQTQAYYSYSHAEGNQTYAFGESSHAEGESSTKIQSVDENTFDTWKNASFSKKFLLAQGQASHAEGKDTLASGKYSHAEGYVTAAVAQGAHAEGCGEYDSNTKEMFHTIAQGYASHAEGIGTTAQGRGAHTEGYRTRANGDFMHVEGDRCYGAGGYSHVGGIQSHSDYVGAFVHGLSCLSSNDYQTVFGQYNVTDVDAVFIIGNGTPSARKNSFTINIDETVHLLAPSYTASANNPKQTLFFKNTTGFGIEPSDDNSNSLHFFELWLQNFSGQDNGAAADMTLVPSVHNSMSIGSGGRRFRSIFGTNIYCSTLNGQSAPGTSSDTRLKNSIALFDNRHERLFDGLQGKTYKYNNGTSNRTHLGFIAQEVQTAIADAGLTEQDCAVVCTINPGEDDEFLTLRYGEFVALNTWQIQKLKSRVQELENMIALLQEKLAD